jgi:hypothetical protein
LPLISIHTTETMGTRCAWPEFPGCVIWFVRDDEDIVVVVVVVVVVVGSLRAGDHNKAAQYKEPSG